MSTSISRTRRGGVNYEFKPDWWRNGRLYTSSFPETHMEHLVRICLKRLDKQEAYCKFLISPYTWSQLASEYCEAIRVFSLQPTDLEQKDLAKRIREIWCERVNPYLLQGPLEEAELRVLYEHFEVNGGDTKWSDLSRQTKDMFFPRFRSANAIKNKSQKYLRHCHKKNSFEAQKLSFEVFKSFFSGTKDKEELALSSSKKQQARKRRERSPQQDCARGEETPAHKKNRDTGAAFVDPIFQTPDAADSRMQPNFQTTTVRGSTEEDALRLEACDYILDVSARDYFTKPSSSAVVEVDGCEHTVTQNANGEPNWDDLPNIFAWEDESFANSIV